ncbi:MAG: SUMF1/EgtB/PvdO family nonheme iron enzyme [Planctomycetota bacterium]
MAPLLVGACTPAGSVRNVDGALARLEQFGFVPQGRASVELDLRRGAKPIEITEPLLVGMYEVTRGEFSRYCADAKPALDPMMLERMKDWTVRDDSLPVSFITRSEAADFASWSGARLLSGSEWLFCAISPRTFAYPWSDSWQQGRANTLDLGLEPHAPTPVGTFEGGRTATHLYDMLGNVWEWVGDDTAGRGSQDARATALGGSFLCYKIEIYREGSFWAEPLESGSRLEDVGFRVCAPARGWLLAHAAELEQEHDVRPRLEAIGRRWGPGAVGLLSELAASARGAARTSLEAILSGARG